MKRIKFVFLGNATTLKTIGHEPDKGNEDLLKEVTAIFEKYASSNSKQFDQRQRITGNDGNYFFTIAPSNVFYMVVAAPEVAERDVFALINEIGKENIALLVDNKTGRLNAIGRQSLRILVDNFNKGELSKIESINVELKETKNIMGQNINKMLNNVDDLKGLEEKSMKIKVNSEIYKKNANDLRKVTWWQNCKWTLILAILIIGVLLAIILPLVLTSSDKNETGTNTQTTATQTGSSTGTGSG